MSEVSYRRPCKGCGRPVRSAWCSGCRPPDRRGTRRERGYDEEWYRRVRRAIARQPFCTYCGATRDLTGDHPIPLVLGGSRDQEPIVACRGCNSRRGGRARSVSVATQIAQTEPAPPLLH